MEKQQLVSVVLPVFNGEKYIREALRSLEVQTHERIEVIIVDDGSIDNTLKIVKEFSERDGRFKIYAQEHKGLVETLKYGILKAKGDFIARMDADDISHRKRIEEQLIILKLQKADICGCGYYTIDKDSIIKRRFHVPIRENEIKFRFGTSVPFCHGSILGRSVIFKKFIYGSCGSAAVEDYSLWSKMMQNSVIFCNCKRGLYFLRSNTDSFTSRKGILVPKGRLAVALEYISNKQEDLLKIIKGRKYISEVIRINNFLASDYLHVTNIISRYHYSGNRIKIEIAKGILNIKFALYVLNTLFGLMYWRILFKNVSKLNK